MLCSSLFRYSSIEGGGGGFYLWGNCEKYRTLTFLNIFGQTAGKIV